MGKERIDARNGLESYLYNLKNTLEDEEKGLADKISAEDKKELQDMIDESLDWMDSNPEADKEDYDEKLKEVEQVANPIMRNCTLPVAVEAMLTMVDTRMTNCKEVPIASPPNIDDGVFVCVSVCRYLIKTIHIKRTTIASRYQNQV